MPSSVATKIVVAGNATLRSVKGPQPEAPGGLQAYSMALQGIIPASVGGGREGFHALEEHKCQIRRAKLTYKQ